MTIFETKPSFMSTLEFITGSAEETIALGYQIGRCLRGGEVFAICGPLGSGKTHLIKGIALGCGCEDPSQVSSPTFVLVNEYAGRFDLYHIDAYRLTNDREFEMLGFDDFLGPGSVVLIEWADKVRSVLAPLECIQVILEHLSEVRRRIRLDNVPPYLHVAP